MTGDKLGPYVVIGDSVPTPFGMRYPVEHRVLGTSAILDVLSEASMLDEHVVDGFLGAARARAAIGHRNVRAVRDCGRLRDGRWYALLDAVDGPNLEQYVTARGAIARPIALEIIAQLANGLEAIRAHGDAFSIAADHVTIAPRDGNSAHVTIEWPTRAIPRLDGGDVVGLATLASCLVAGCATDDIVDDLAGPWTPILRGALERHPASPPTPRALALALASSIDGIEIVRRSARELLDTGDLVTTFRAGQKRRTTRYQRGARIGEGGMGEVFRATTKGAFGFSRPVAIKYVHPALAEIAPVAKRFIAEAHIASKLAHPNIVAVLDFDRDAENRLFLAMEYVDGVSLDRIFARGALSPELVTFVGGEILRGLGHAHARRVIHRDVSPQNVLVSFDGVVKVSDFGLAQARDAAPVGGARVGKPPYRSPEHIGGGPLDERTDLFCCGIVLWELLTGRALFDGSERDILAKIARMQIPRPRSIRPAIPEELEAVVMKLLEREPSARFATAEAAISALAETHTAGANARAALIELLARRPERRSVRRRASSTRTVRARPMRARQSTPGWTRRHWLAVLVVCAITGIAAGAIATL